MKRLNSKLSVYKNNLNNDKLTYIKNINEDDNLKNIYEIIIDKERKNLFNNNRSFKFKQINFFHFF